MFSLFPKVSRLTKLNTLWNKFLHQPGQSWPVATCNIYPSPSLYRIECTQYPNMSTRRVTPSPFFTFRYKTSCPPSSSAVQYDHVTIHLGEVATGLCAVCRDGRDLMRIDRQRVLARACGVPAVAVRAVDCWQWCSGHYSPPSPVFFPPSWPFLIEGVPGSKNLLSESYLECPKI